MSTASAEPAFHEQVSRTTCTLTDKHLRSFIMKKTIAAVIAGLFATAAFAQTPAAPATSKPASKQAVLVNNADLKASKANTTKPAPVDAPAVQADTKVSHDDGTAVKAPAKDAKTSAKHAKSKTKHVAKTDTMKDTPDSAAAATPTAPVAPEAPAAPVSSPSPAETPVPVAPVTPAPETMPAPAATPTPAAPVTQ
jgi:hypothetical protein